MVEKELKFKIQDINKLLDKLDNLGAKKEKRVFERTVMFDNSSGIMKVTDGRLRLRTKIEENGTKGAQLSYKKPLTRKGIKQEIDIVVDIGDPQKIEKILYYADYKPVSSYERFRTIYYLYDAEISIDEFPFGNYIEVEADNLEKLRELATKLDFSMEKNITLSYDTLYYNQRISEGKEPIMHIVFTDKDLGR
ncbi:MAG: class IV adenylate cyclase [bacterium]